MGRWTVERERVPPNDGKLKKKVGPRKNAQKVGERPVQWVGVVTPLKPDYRTEQARGKREDSQVRNVKKSDQVETEGVPKLRNVLGGKPDTKKTVKKWGDEKKNKKSSRRIWGVNLPGLLPDTFLGVSGCRFHLP